MVSGPISYRVFRETALRIVNLYFCAAMNSRPSFSWSCVWALHYCAMRNLDIFHLYLKVQYEQIMLTVTYFNDCTCDPKPPKIPPSVKKPRHGDLHSSIFGPIVLG